MDQSYNISKLNLIPNEDKIYKNYFLKAIHNNINETIIPNQNQTIYFNPSKSCNLPSPYSQQTSNFQIHPQYQTSHFSNRCIQHLVKTLPPTDRKYLKEYCYVKCPNVTTVWINSYGFSYLTSYSNDENYFFLPLTDNGFNLNDWNENSTNNKVSRENLSEFISQLNSQFEISKLIKTLKEKIKKRHLIFLIFAIVFFILSITFFILWMNYLADFIYLDKNFLFIAGICFFFCGMIFLICLLFLCLNCYGKNKYLMDKVLIRNTSGVENFLNKWNIQYFLLNDLYVMAPRNLRYLQFVLKRNIKFSLENHPYPNDLTPNRLINFYI